MYVDMTSVGTSVCSRGQSGCALCLQLLGVVPVVQSHTVLEDGALGYHSQ